MTAPRRALPIENKGWWGTSKVTLVCYSLGIGIMIGVHYGQGPIVDHYHTDYLMAAKAHARCATPQGLAITTGGTRLICTNNRWIRDDQ